MTLDDFKSITSGKVIELEAAAIPFFWKHDKVEKGFVHGHISCKSRWLGSGSFEKWTPFQMGVVEGEVCCAVTPVSTDVTRKFGKDEDKWARCWTLLLRPYSDNFEPWDTPE